MHAHYRKNGIPFFRFFIIAIAALPALCGSGCRRHATLDAPVVPPKVVDSVRPVQRACPEAFSRAIKRGQTFARILDSFGFAPLEIDRMYRAMAGHGLSKIYPGDSLIVSLDQSCTPFRIALLSKMKDWYTATWQNSAVTVEKRPLSFIESRCIVNGVLETSLLDAMQTSGLGPFLACKLADIFAWDINFFLDPRKGDTFQILFKQKFAENRFVGYGDVLAARYTCNGKDFYAIGFCDSFGTVQYYDRSGKSVQKEFLKAPLRFSRITSGFSYHRKHPILGIVRPHFGIDYAAPAGTPVYAAADGKVTTAGWDNNFGKNVVISHGGAYTTYYGHLSSISSGIYSGAYVRQGQMIGTVGATGLATGPHLDYRMKRNGCPVNPRTVVLPSKCGIGQDEQEAFTRLSTSFLALLDHRCAKKSGYYVLDIKSNAPVRDSALHASLSSASESTHGGKPGS
jgi:murein DD-endopeptidase MepM/ murein hydrolase activator NlpD